MKAAVLVEPRHFELQEVPRPEPGDGQVRIRVEGCGICGSNGPVWQGRPWFRYPIEPGAPGHEGWGVVDGLGAGVDHRLLGARVAYLSGRALAEYDVATATSMVVLPPVLAGQMIPGEAIGCAVNVFHRAEVRAGQTVAVIGVGFLGAIVVKLASAAGARVIALGRRPSALELARQLGAAETMTVDDPERVIEVVTRSTEGRLCPRVIEVTGEQAPLDLATQLTGERGRLVIAGYHQDGKREVDMQLWNWRGLDVINAHERDPAVYVNGMREAVDLLATGRLDARRLVTHRFPVDQIDQAFQAMHERPPGFLKAAVTW
jgi:2-desacetyl-2-hydroxyethyl bacteriochlorophyllide A dehydrogenase